MLESLKEQKTIFLSTLDRDNLPHVSYAPYYMRDDKVYIYISEMAKHYQNLLDNENIGVMIIEDEGTAANKLARKRVSFNGVAELKNISEIDEEVISAFENNFGKEMLAVIMKLDFHFFEISLGVGRIVKGFGEAFDLVYENNAWVEKALKADMHKTR